MPAAWIGAGAAVLGAVNSGGGGSTAAQGAANIAGGALSANEAIALGNQLAQTANPFGQYNQQYAAQLAGLGSVNAQGQGTFGQGAGAAQILPTQNFANSSQGLTGALNGQQYGQQINQLLANPDSVYQTQQYKSAFGQGQNAVNATLAAQGLNASGNQLAALQSYGQTFGQQAYGTQLSQLSGLYGQALGANQQQFNQFASAGQLGLQQNQQAFGQLAQMSGLATGSPTAAAAAQAQVYQNVNSAYGSVGQGIGQLASGAGSLLNGLSGSGTTGFTSGQGTSTSGFGDVSGSGGLFGTSAGTNNTGGFTTGGGGNSWGFTE